MTTAIALSTSLCTTPSAPDQILNRWAARKRDVSCTLSIDPRIPTAVQQTLLDLATKQRIGCSELTHALQGERRQTLASLASHDRDERQTAQRQLTETLRLAATYRIKRVVLFPLLLPLTPAIDELCFRFSIDRLDSAIEALEDQRERFGSVALDGLRLSIDPIFNLALQLGVQLAWATPAIWPHQFPDEDEIDALRQEFSGAPLTALHCSDWSHARGLIREEPSPSDNNASLAESEAALAAIAISLGVSDPSRLWIAGDQKRTEEPDGAAIATTATPRALRWADACGLRLRLPLGSGEIDWKGVTQSIAHNSEITLTLDTDASSYDVEESFRFATQLRAAASASQ